MQNNLNFNVNPHILTNPMQQIMELNQKTLKKFSYMEPQELTKVRDPNSLLQNNMDVFIDNSHTSLDYMYQLFNILEHSWINLFSEAGDKTKKIMETTKSATTTAMNKMSDYTSKTAHSHSASHTSKKRTNGSSAHSSRAHTKKNEPHKNALSASSSSTNKDATHKSK